MKHQIYLITNHITGKIYVGQTNMGLRRRFGKHKEEARKGTDTYLYSSMRLYGDKYFSICYLADGGDTTEEANAAEVFWIKYLDANSPETGYNLTSGGGVGYSLSESSRKKIGDAARKPAGPEQECLGCRKIKLLEEYHVNNSVSNGRMGRCKECCVKQVNEKYWSTEGPERAAARQQRIEEKQSRPNKWCNWCDQVLPLDCFYVSKSHTDGRLTTCKQCRNNNKRKKAPTLEMSGANLLTAVGLVSAGSCG